MDDKGKLILPDFSMDCRDWLVVTPHDAGLPDEFADAPLLAVLSTVVLDEAQFRPASGVLTVGLMDDELPLTRPIGTGCVAAEVLELDGEDDGDSVSYVLPTPDRRMALVAEFNASAHDTELRDRIEALMASFRWAA
jgi:hypothetical protein